MSKKFIEYVGGSFINGKGVAVDDNNGTIEIAAETTGDKKISYTIKITKEDYAKLRAEWYADDFKGDAAITARALDYMLSRHGLGIKNYHS